MVGEDQKNLDKKDLEPGDPVCDSETGKIYMLLEILEDEGLARVSIGSASKEISIGRLENV